MEKIKSLLNQVAIISKKNAEILDATGSRFNMFRVCGVNHYENTHSAIIAEFLNPKGTHGLKHKLLESFIETLGEEFKIQSFNLEKAHVFTEYSTEEGRIDILIEDNQNKAIIIENKIYAGDQFEQLKRYDRYAQTYKDDYQILYLTLGGENASNQSGDGVDYLPISHKETIINWLEKSVAISSRFPMVRETIIQYINHLKQLTNQDMDTRNKEEIVELLSMPGSLRAAETIHRNYLNVFNYIVEKHFSPKMEEFARQKGLKYNYVRTNTNEFHIHFHLAHPSWKECKIEFGFPARNYRYGISNNPEKYNFSDENIKILHEHFKSLDISFLQGGEWWPLYADLENLSLDVWENDILKSENFLNDCKGKIEELLTAMELIEL